MPLQCQISINREYLIHLVQNVDLLMSHPAHASRIHVAWVQNSSGRTGTEALVALHGTEHQLVSR